mgnify:CR=1 FL=1
MVYADYAATHPYVKYPSSAYGPFLNPNANYAYKEKRLLTEAENRVKKAIGAKSGKVVFGGTSSQLIENLMNVILSSEYSCDVFCSKYEHDSFFRYRDDSFYDKDELELLLSQADNYTIPIVLWQAVQNITGEIFPTKQIGGLVHKYNGFYICDGTAQIGHTPIEPNIDDWCDFLILDGHKAGTELGIGCCWISNRLDKWLNGFKLHGTPNLAGALAMTQAVEDACDSRKLGQNMIHYGELLDHLIDGLVEKNVDFQLILEYEDNEPSNKFALAINAIRLPGFNADALQQYLAFKQIYVSIGGSACTEKHDYRVLNAYGLSNDEASEVIRVSFGEDSSVEDVGALVEGIKEFRDTYVK